MMMLLFRIFNMFEASMFENTRVIKAAKRNFSQHQQRFDAMKLPLHFLRNNFLRMNLPVARTFLSETSVYFVHVDLTVR